MSGWGTLDATRRTAPFDWRSLHRGYAYFVAERFDGSTIATTESSEAASAALRTAPNMSRKVGVTHDGQRVELAVRLDPDTTLSQYRARRGGS